MLWSQMEQGIIPEEIFAHPAEVVHRIGIQRTFRQVAVFTARPVFSIQHKACRKKLDRPRTADDMKLQEPVVRHAQPHCSAFEVVLHAVSLSLEIIPLFRLRRVFACVLASLIGTVASDIAQSCNNWRVAWELPVLRTNKAGAWIEREYVHRGRAEHGHKEVVRDDPASSSTHSCLMTRETDVI